MRTDGMAAQYLKPGLCCGQLFIVVPFASRLGASDRTNEGFALEMNIVLRNGSVFAFFLPCNPHVPSFEFFSSLPLVTGTLPSVVFQ